MSYFLILLFGICIGVWGNKEVNHGRNPFHTLKDSLKVDKETEEEVEKESDKDE